MQTKEIVPIPGFSRYGVCENGNLYSFNYKNSNKVKQLAPALNREGYLKTMLKKDGGGYATVYVHKMVVHTFLGVENSKEINHKNGIKTDNSKHNLEYCTRSENIAHAYSLNLLTPKVGSSNGMSKLTEKDVREIRAHAAANGRYYGRKALALKYGVCECTIKEVVVKRRNKFYNVP